MKRTNELIVALAVMAVIVVIIWSAFAMGTNLPRGATPLSQDLYSLHNLVLAFSVVVAVLVYTAMFTSVILHRKSRNFSPSRVKHSLAAELIWTAIPVVMLTLMAIPATRILLDMDDSRGAGLEVRITGQQWQWRYEYPAQGLILQAGLATPDPDSGLPTASQALVLPTNTRIRLLLNSADVIHSWWVPELGVKKDALPGLINEAWVLIEEAGMYEGQCSELCGSGHGYMPILVEARTPEAWQAWVESQRQIQDQGQSQDPASDGR